MANMPLGNSTRAIVVLIKWFTICHFEGFRVEFGIDTIMIAVLGDEEFGIFG